MADPLAPRQTPKQRASFGRAERLRKARLDLPKESQVQGAQKARPAPAKPHRRPSRPAAPDRRSDLLAHAKERVASALEDKASLHKELERQRVVRRCLETRAADRRRDETRRAEHTRRDAEIAKGQQRKADWQKQQERKVQDRRRDDIRKAFARKAEDRRQLALKRAEQQRQAQLKEVARKAAAAIDAEHKRQREEQQQAHRHETDQVRSRHRRDMDSLRSNELHAVERHHGAVRRLDAAEQRELSELVVGHKSLTGRIAGLKPGTAQARERETQAVRDRYEAERTKAHRDLEALKERQFQHAQATRLQHARERLAAMGAHRDGRQALQQRQQTDRPRLVEGRQQAMVAAKANEQTRERQHDRAEHRSPAATPAFNERSR